MAKRRRKSRRYKNPKRVRAARRAYKRSGLFKYNQRRKRHGKRKGKYSRKRHRRHHRRFRRLSKHRAYAARLARRLAKSKRVHHAPAFVGPQLPAHMAFTKHQRKNLERLREKFQRLKQGGFN